MFNEKAEKLNGRAAMVGSSPPLVPISQQVKLSQVCGERHVTHSSFHGRRVHLCRPIDRRKC